MVKSFLGRSFLVTFVSNSHPFLYLLHDGNFVQISNRFQFWVVFLYLSINHFSVKVSLIWLGFRIFIREIFFDSKPMNLRCIKENASHFRIIFPWEYTLNRYNKYEKTYCIRPCIYIRSVSLFFWIIWIILWM